MNADVRADVKRRLRLLTEQEKASFSQSVVSRIQSVPDYQKAQTVALFLPMDDEPQIAPLIEESLRRGKRVFAPKTVGRAMFFIEITERTEYAVGTFSVKEPIGERYEGDFDIILVPEVAFDRKCNRMGHGCGYYDRFLPTTEAKKIGIAFSCQQADFEVFEYDVPTDYVVTEREIIVRK